MYREYISELVDTLKQTRIEKDGKEIIDYDQAMGELIQYITNKKKQGKQLFFIGNGGSSAIASHMTADFMKNGGMKTTSLYDNALTTCMGNDYGYEYIFSRPLSFLGNDDDLLIAISSSGNSMSIVNAVEVAEKKGMGVITFSGFLEDNKIRTMGCYNVYVPISHYGIVESIHTIILQQIVDEILKRDGVTI